MALTKEHALKLKREMGDDGRCPLKAVETILEKPRLAEILMSFDNRFMHTCWVATVARFDRAPESIEEIFDGNPARQRKAKAQLGSLERLKIWLGADQQFPEAKGLDASMARQLNAIIGDNAVKSVDSRTGVVIFDPATVRMREIGLSDEGQSLEQMDEEVFKTGMKLLPAGRAEERGV